MKKASKNVFKIALIRSYLLMKKYNKIKSKNRNVTLLGLVEGHSMPRVKVEGQSEIIFPLSVGVS